MSGELMRAILHCRRFVTERSGVSAVEFALVAPVMILLFMGTIELPRAYTTGQHANRAARSMADLISRTSLTAQEVDGVYTTGRSMMAPYDATAAKIILTSAGVYQQKDGSFKAKVCSSTASNAQKYAASTDLGVPPPSEAVDKARYVIAKMTIEYRPIFDIFPALTSFSFEKEVTWPIRATNGKPIILPGGVTCPAT
jgi:Flp pilus assembly protein TadG